MDEWVDLNGVPLGVNDRVIFARPVNNYGSGGGARLDVGTIVRFTKKGVTIQIENKEHRYEALVFNTPYRANKFIRMEND